MKLTHKRLRELLDYDPETGHFTWKETRCGRAIKGNRAGSPDISEGGYIRIYVDGVRCKGHRLAWFWMTGEWPNQLDHKNCDRFDNRWQNLREAVGYQNNANSSRYKSNTSGFKGVHRSWGTWLCRIQINHDRLDLGSFRNKIDAAICYNTNAAHLFGGFANFNSIPQTGYSHD